MGGVLRRIAKIERLEPRNSSKVFGRVRGWVSKLTLECGHSVYRPRCKEPRTHARCEECTMKNFEELSGLAEKYRIVG